MPKGCTRRPGRGTRGTYLCRRDSGDVLVRQGSENGGLACIVQPQDQDAGLQQRNTTAQRQLAAAAYMFFVAWRKLVPAAASAAGLPLPPSSLGRGSVRGDPAPCTTPGGQLDMLAAHGYLRDGQTTNLPQQDFVLTIFAASLIQVLQRCGGACQRPPFFSCKWRAPCHGQEGPKKCDASSHCCTHSSVGLCGHHAWFASLPRINEPVWDV